MQPEIRFINVKKNRKMFLIYDFLPVWLLLLKKFDTFLFYLAINMKQTI